MTTIFVLAGAAAFIITAAVTPLVGLLASRLRLTDTPGDSRKIHSRPVPLLGGLAIFLGLLAAVALFSAGLYRPFGDFVQLKQLLGLALGGAVLMIGGFLDDKYKLPPRLQIIFTVAAAAIVVGSGVGPSHIRNPLGGILRLDLWTIPLWPAASAPLVFLPKDLFTFAWLLGLIYTTKLLDGLDGLATGITAIGALIIFFVSLLPFVHQPETAFLAIAFAGALAGFLVWNWHPAKIFLGEGGSTFLGFLLGVLAVISGSKVATTLLVVGIPALDVAWVIGRRVFLERRSPAVGDRGHLHFRLLDAGLTHRQAVGFLYLFSGAFGLLSLFLQTRAKAVALFLLFILMVALTLFAVRRRRHV